MSAEPVTPRILVIGCGGVGVAYTYVLHKVVPESNIFAVCRSNYNEAAANGFTFHSSVWGSDQRVRPTVVPSIDQAAVLSQGTPFDFVVICSKITSSSINLPESLRPVISDKTAIVLFQNGIGIEAPYKKLYPANPVISGVVYISSFQTSPGVVTHNSSQHLNLGTYPSKAPENEKQLLAQFASILSDGGASVEVHDDVQVERWSKALINTAWNPITALTRSGDSSFLYSNSDAPQFVREIMLEIALVAQSCGYPQIDSALVDKQLARALARQPPGVKMSMSLDAESKREMEVDVVIGNVLALAKENGVSTPSLKSIFLLLNALNLSFKA